MYDIVIVGLGPAGSTLARLLAPKYNILCLEKRDLTEAENTNNKNDKCCGGLISENAQQSLRKLGLKIPNHIISDEKVTRLDVWDFDNNIKSCCKKNYYNIDRYKFDKWLIDMIPKNVAIDYSAKFIKAEKIDVGNYKIVYEKDGEVKETTATYIIGADGANSAIRKGIVKEHSDSPRYVAIQNWYRNTYNADIQVAITDKEITDFYSWIISKGEYILVGSALRVGGDSTEKFRNLIDKIKESGFKIDDNALVKTHGIHIRRPISLSKDILLGNENIFLIGEAAGLISPSSAEGYSYAFESAIALSKGLNIKRYDKNIIKLKYRIWFANNIKSKAMYNRFIRKIFISMLQCIGKKERITEINNKDISQFIQ